MISQFYIFVADVDISPLFPNQMSSYSCPQLAVSIFKEFHLQLYL